MIDLTVLKTELDTDPQTLGYSSLNDREAANKLNEAGSSGETIDVTCASTIDLQAAVVGSEFDLLSAGKQRAWLAIVGLSEVPVKSTTLRGQILEIFADGTTTRSNLGALQSKSATRGEKVFEEDTSISYNDVKEARRLV